jgi:serine phosphatase RsbU (regulator of sigma subunit)
MAALQVLKGANEGELIPLEGDRFVLGRNPDCGIVIPITSVSREHAQILRIKGRYYIEDKQSRNGTYVNNQAVTERVPLRNNDKIRICDFVAAFVDGTPAPDDGGEDTSSTVEATLAQSSLLLLDTQPAEKLRALLEISTSLGKNLELDKLLPQIVDSLFGLFRHADRCFLIQADETGKLRPRVVKARKPHEEMNARFSRSIVRQCLETAQAFLSDDASKDDRVQLSQSVVDFRIRSVMCVPLVGANGKAFGVIQLDTQDRGKKFNQEDLKLLWGVAGQASVAMENAKLHEEAVARERKLRDLELGHQVQLSFLPRSLPQVPGYEFAAHYEPALEVGGDYYGFIPLPGGKLAVAVGDVAGKGVPAALLMAKLSSEARFCLLTEPDPARAVARLNDLLCEFVGPMDRFVTLSVAVLDPDAHTASLITAGHPAPLLVRRGQAGVQDAAPRDAAGFPLGMLEGSEYRACPVRLAPGDALLCFTDGITEAVDVRNAEFGLPGVEAAVRAAKDAGPGAVVDRLVKSVQAHASGRDPHDDITLVCFGRP